MKKILITIALLALMVVGCTSDPQYQIIPLNDPDPIVVNLSYFYDTGGFPVNISTPKEANGGIPVNLQDQTSRAFDLRFCQALSSPYTLAANGDPGSYTLNLTSVVGLAAGEIIGLFQDSTNPASFFAEIESINGNELTLDTPVDNYFNTSLSPVLFELGCDASVDGSVTPQVFSIDNDADIPIDITRVLMHMTDASSMDNGLFGGLSALDRGVVLRKMNSDGSYTNYFNRAVKTNGDFALFAYDLSYDDKAPAGLYGVRVRYTFAGQDKHGVAVRLMANESLQLLVQDDLTGLASFQIVAEGHFVQE